ncbi:hypothetical protein DFH09DRAFT_1331205 [Mycena vulgaris]|nr:hypothetical protein DFH09DRAFT_1331205 [Mycena vulgaris]
MPKVSKHQALRQTLGRQLHDPHPSSSSNDENTPPDPSEAIPPKIQTMSSPVLKDQLHVYRDVLKDEIPLKTRWKDMATVAVRRTLVLEARVRELARRDLSQSTSLADNPEAMTDIPQAMVIDDAPRVDFAASASLILQHATPPTHVHIPAALRPPAPSPPGVHGRCTSSSSLNRWDSDGCEDPIRLLLRNPPRNAAEGDARVESGSRWSHGPPSYIPHRILHSMHGRTARLLPPADPLLQSKPSLLARDLQCVWTHTRLLPLPLLLLQYRRRAGSLTPSIDSLTISSPCARARAGSVRILCTSYKALPHPIPRRGRPICGGSCIPCPPSSSSSPPAVAPISARAALQQYTPSPLPVPSISSTRMSLGRLHKRHEQRDAKPECPSAFLQNRRSARIQRHPSPYSSFLFRASHAEISPQSRRGATVTSLFLLCPPGRAERVTRARAFRPIPSSSLPHRPRAGTPLHGARRNAAARRAEERWYTLPTARRTAAPLALPPSSSPRRAASDPTRAHPTPRLLPHPIPA